MRNRLFKLTVGVSIAFSIALSLSLGVIFTIAWITSYFHRISFAHQTRYDTVSLAINRGKTELLWSNWQPLAPGEKIDPNPRFFGTVDWPTIGVLGVYVPRVKDPAHFRGTNAVVTFPAGLLAIFATLAPLSFMVLKPKRKPQPNRCRVCDYDLRATPDRCPECGNPVRFLFRSLACCAPIQESPRRCRGAGFVERLNAFEDPRRRRGLLSLQ